MTLNIKLYPPKNTVSYNGRMHVWDGEALSEDKKKSKSPDLSITVEGIPGMLTPEFIYGRTKDASDGKAYYCLRLCADKSSASYNALDKDSRKTLDKEIQKVNKVLKNKKNRVHFSVNPLDLSDFTYDTGKSNTGKKVFVRRGVGNDTLSLEAKMFNYIDPKTWTVRSAKRTVLNACLDGQSFRVTKKDYKVKSSSGFSEIMGKNRNLTGTTAGG